MEISILVGVTIAIGMGGRKLAPATLDLASKAVAAQRIIRSLGWVGIEIESMI